MKEAREGTTYFYLDEAGDPVFFNRKGDCIVGRDGCSKILIIGFIYTEDPRPIRLALEALRREIGSDAYLKSIPSLAKSLQSFHAKDDCPEVREKVYRLIATLNFKAQFIVARKRLDIFQGRHKSSEQIFYNDLVTKALENKLHITTENKIIYATRSNKTRQEPMDNAIQSAVLAFEKKWNTAITTKREVQPQTPTGEPCLQVADYMNWAVQRAYQRGEMRYFDFIRDKVSLLVDIYDSDKYPNTYYSAPKNPFELNKISPL